TLPIDHLYPPTPAAKEGVLDEAENRARIQEALQAPAAELHDSNVLIVGDRLMSTRWQVSRVAWEIQQDSQANRPVLSLGVNHLQTALPFICALGAWRARRWARLDWAHEPPHLDTPPRQLIDSLVARLVREQALVVVPCSGSDPDSDVGYFLDRCA